jgi:hypothetical protein
MITENVAIACSKNIGFNLGPLTYFEMDAIISVPVPCPAFIFKTGEVHVIVNR